MLKKSVKNRNYIVDFVDEENKILYEIKPLFETDKKLNKDKEKYAKLWCKDNNYKYILITEEYFSNNINLILKIKVSNKKLKKAISYFKRVHNNENKKN